MSAYKNISERIKNIISKFHGKNTEEYINPVRHWILGLFFATLTLVGGVLYIIADFKTQFSVEHSDTVTGAPLVIYREKDVQAYAELYREKETTFNELRKNREYVAPVILSTPESVSKTDEEEVLADSPVAE